MLKRHQSGFTLIELAVVIAIIGLLVGGAVASFSAIRINTKIKETQAAIDNAELLLQAFVARNGRLPCPAEPMRAQTHEGYGKEANLTGYGDDGAGGGCTDSQEIGSGTNVYWGTLPAESLGSRVDDLADGWSTQLLYVVSGSATLTNSLTNGAWQATSNISLWDDLSMPAGEEVIDDGVIALLSVGANRNGGYTLDGQLLPSPPTAADAEKENLGDGDLDFVTVNYSNDPDEPFDDILRVLREDDIVLPLALRGDVKTKRALTTERAERLLDLIYGHAAADGADHAIPDNADPGVGTEGSVGTAFPWADLGIPSAVAVNAWNTPFTYVVDTNLEICTPDGATAVADDVLFTLSSVGPDGTVIQRTRGEAAGHLIAAGITLNPCP